MNAPVIAAVDDMFFATKIRATAEALGVAVSFARNSDALEKLLCETIPQLIILDLHSRRCDPFAIAERIKRDERISGVPLVGFYSHVQTELQKRAQAAGINHVMPRSAFTKRLPEILQGQF
ncbi:MAG: hypothetical protein ACR2GW_09980 [Pyrinomonadaceae bacterium]|nr:response regulator [Acidobacteriota bacterium]